MQGSAWFGIPVLDNNGGQYATAATTYNWSFPAGALIGYGAIGWQKERPNNPSDQGMYQTIVAPPIDETSPLYPLQVGPLGFNSTDDFEFRDSTMEANDHVFNTFYFGPTVTGTVRITVNATFKSLVAGVPDFSGSDYVDVNVVRPTGKITINSTGDVGVSLPSVDGQELVFGVGYPNAVGIDFSAYIDPTYVSNSITKNVAGQFMITQTMASLKEGRYISSGTTYTDTFYRVMPGGTDPGVMLDSFIYPGTLGTVGIDQLTHNPRTTNSNDSPGSRLKAPTETSPKYNVDIMRSDSFTQTLMYQPPGGIWIPVGSLPWSWAGVARWASELNRPIFVPELSSKNIGSYSPSTTFPS
jgi:hypothetical protein